MELQTFITSAFDQIITGVRDAQKKHPSSDIGGKISVGAESSAGSFVYMAEGGYCASVVHFDLSVTITADAAANAGAKISILGFGAEINGTQSKEFSNRIKFSIPVKLEK